MVFLLLQKGKFFINILTSAQKNGIQLEPIIFFPNVVRPVHKTGLIRTHLYAIGFFSIRLHLLQYYINWVENAVLFNKLNFY